MRSRAWTSARAFGDGWCVVSGLSVHSLLVPPYWAQLDTSNTVQQRLLYILAETMGADGEFDRR